MQKRSVGMSTLALNVGEKTAPQLPCRRDANHATLRQSLAVFQNGMANKTALHDVIGTHGVLRHWMFVAKKEIIRHHWRTIRRAVGLCIEHQLIKQNNFFDQ